MQVDSLLKHPPVDVVLVIEITYPVFFKVLVDNFENLLGSLRVSQFQLFEPVEVRPRNLTFVSCRSHFH